MNPSGRQARKSARIKSACIAFGAAALIAAMIAAPGAMTSAHAGIIVHVDKSAQTLTVSVDGFPAYQWPTSTGRSGYRTPVGTFRPQRLERHWYSRKYDNSPMPYSVFFHKGYAIHGTNYVSRLGRRASHGCIRLHPRHAATLFSLIRAHGKANTRIVISN